MSTSYWSVVVVALAVLLVGSNLWRLDAADVSEPQPADISMSYLTPMERRAFIEALHSQSVEYEKLLGVILQLSKAVDRDQILSALQAELGINPIIKDDFVLFGRLALKFDENERLVDLFVAIEGTTTPGKVVIRSESEMRNDT